MKMQHFIFALLLLISSAGYAQKEFFRSQQVFTNAQMEKFYSSVTIHNDLVIFNANDYQLYAYNKNDGSVKWLTKTSYKTNMPVFVQGDVVYAGLYKDESELAAQFSLADGKLMKILPFGPLGTKPLIKNGMLYGTAIYNFGCIVAYDLAGDTVSWSRFIAHGFSTQPYYLENKIWANAEGNNWVALGYDGVLLDTGCSVKANIFVEDIPCINNFSALSHNGLEIKGKLEADIFGVDNFGQPDMLTTKKFTFILYDDKLTILSGKLKIKQVVEVSSLAPGMEGMGYTKLLKADDENTWLMYDNHLLHYNHKTKVLLKSTDLSSWEPRQVVLDGENAWVISGKDGLLYGLSL